MSELFGNPEIRVSHIAVHFITGPLIEKADYVFMSKDVAREKGYDSKEKAVAGLSESCKQG